MGLTINPLFQSPPIDKMRLRAAFAHQVGEVGALATHELPLLAHGRHPVVNGLVQVLTHVVLKVVSTIKPVDSDIWQS